MGNAPRQAMPPTAPITLNGCKAPPNKRMPAMPKDPDAVVIGVGAAGLTAAIELARTGLAVRLTMRTPPQMFPQWQRRRAA